MVRSLVSETLRGAALAGLLGLTACAEVMPPSYSLDKEQKTLPASSWQQAASDMWQEVSTRLQAGGYHETEIAIEPPMDQTAFTQALDNFLFTEAVDHGVAVTPSPDSQFTITYDTQIIRHASDDDVSAPLLTPNVVDKYDDEAPGSATELVLNVSVTDGTSVRIRASRVFDIAEGDVNLYQPNHGNKTAEELSNQSLVSSNWYSANPHDVLPIAMHEDNQFAIMIDHADGPVRDMPSATTVAARHCGSLGMAEAKYISESYPTNDRNQIRVVYECM
jgi:hypothetical protein